MPSYPTYSSNPSGSSSRSSSSGIKRDPVPDYRSATNYTSTSTSSSGSSGTKYRSYPVIVSNDPNAPRDKDMSTKEQDVRYYPRSSQGGEPYSRNQYGSNTTSAQSRGYYR